MTEQGTNVDQGEALYNRLRPFLDALYQQSLDLGTTSPLTRARFDELRVASGLEDLAGLTPDTILELVAAEANELADVANLGGTELAALSQKTGLSEARIRITPWAPTLTSYHLLGMTGTPVNDAMSRLYPQSETPSAEVAA